MDTRKKKTPEHLGTIRINNGQSAADLVRDWTRKIRDGGGSMNADKASGVLHSTLERLALHYGMVDMGRIASIRQDGAYGRAIREFLDFVGVFATTATSPEKNAIGRFTAVAEKRFAKFI